MLKNQSLAGKFALVTGGTRGIGRAISERLRDEGARVAVTGTKPDGESPANTEYHAIDFSDLEATCAFAEEVSSLGPDILVNNAGINIISPFAEINPDDFLRIQQINVTAPFLLCRAAIPGMKRKGWGRIVNISSIWGKIAKEHRGAYGASKFALDGLTAALAAEIAEWGILANCIAPGFIDTDMTRDILGDEQIKKIIQTIPIKRLGQPEEIAVFVSWLAGVENTYVSGQNFAIDGGVTRV